MADRPGYGRLTAPVLIEYELANVCLMKGRRGPEKTPLFAASFSKLAAFALDLRDVDIGEVFLLAAENGLTAYDASYLWLARHLGAELITLDKKLKVAAAR